MAFDWGDAAGSLWGSISGHPLEWGVGAAGAAGTGFGIWDLVRANQEAQKRDWAAKHWLRTHPVEDYYTQLASPATIEAMARGPMANVAASGIESGGGAWRQAATDTAAGIRGQLYPIAQAQQQQEFGGLFGGPAYGYQPQAAGALGGMGQAFQTMMLMRALAGRGQDTTSPGMVDTSALPGMQLPPSGWSGVTGEMPGGRGAGGYSLYGSPFGSEMSSEASSFYPDYAMAAY